MTKAKIKIQIENDTEQTFELVTPQKTNLNNGNTVDKVVFDFKQSEYDKAFDTYKAQILTLVPLVTGFVTVNATVLGLGVTFQKAWLFLVGAIFSFAIRDSISNRDTSLCSNRT